MLFRSKTLTVTATAMSLTVEELTGKTVLTEPMALTVPTEKTVKTALTEPTAKMVPMEKTA